ncbi:MAG: 4'-phosphopantetheinyl transferase superfamily protein [Gemmatimonadetes bacterium]|nr:4'-phosphopantetheinyl transferase superfamily protein [Gemmatimonadota bacterium]
MTTPGGTRVRVVHERDVPAADAWLDPVERKTLAGLHVPKRRADWLRGRWAAKRAVAHWARLGESPSDLARVGIRPAPDGAPEAFVDDRPGPVLSISHSGPWAAAAVAPRGPLGCDLEEVRPLDDATVDLFFTEAERAEMRREAAGSARDQRTILLWSAKESALKALRAGLRRDTREVEASTGREAEAGWGSLRVRDDADGRVFEGWWRNLDGLVLTVVEGCAPSRRE